MLTLLVIFMNGFYRVFKKINSSVKAGVEIERFVSCKKGLLQKRAGFHGDHRYFILIGAAKVFMSGCHD